MNTNNTMFFSFSEPLAREHFQAKAQQYHDMMDRRVSGSTRQMSAQFKAVKTVVNARLPKTGKAEKVLKTVAGFNAVEVTEEGVSFKPVGLVALAALNQRHGKNFDLAKTKHEAVNQGFDAVFQAYQHRKLEMVVAEAEAKREAELAEEADAARSSDEADLISSNSSDDITIDIEADDVEKKPETDEPVLEESGSTETEDQPKKSKFSRLMGALSKLFSFLFGWMKSSKKVEVHPEEKV